VYLSVLTTSIAIGAILQFRASRIFRSEKDTGILPVDVESRAKGYGRALWINNVLDLAVWQQSGVFFLWLFVGSNYAGQFSIAYTLTYVLIGLLSGSIVSSLFPEFSKLYGGGDAQRGHSTFRVGFKANTLLVAPVATFLVLGGSSLAAVLFGAKFDQAGDAIFLLAISSGFVAIGGLATSFGYAQEKHFSWMKIALASSVLATALFLVMVPLMGLLGAVIVQAWVQVLGISIVLYVVAAHMKVHIPWRHCCIVVGLAAASYLTAYVGLGLMSMGTSFLVMWCALGSVIYVLFVLALAMYDADTFVILRTAKIMLKTIIGV
jgi:O-antigen/teichoic acid export membrane protein